jgi:hypothetical protein
MYPWVLPTVTYQHTGDLTGNLLPLIIDAAERMARQQLKAL